MTRVIVTGCRNWRCFALADRVVKRLAARHCDLVIVHGAADGVDNAFHDAAIRAEVGIEPHPADWKKHGKGAGPKRNAEMVAKGAALCLAVHRDIRNSRGTGDCVRRAIGAGIPTWLLDADDAEPKRLTLDYLTAPAD